MVSGSDESMSPAPAVGHSLATERRPRDHDISAAQTQADREGEYFVEAGPERLSIRFGKKFRLVSAAAFAADRCPIKPWPIRVRRGS